MSRLNGLAIASSAARRSSELTSWEGARERLANIYISLQNPYRKATTLLYLLLYNRLPSQIAVIPFDTI